MVLGRIFPKITKFYLDGSPAEAEIAYPDKVRRVHIRLGGQEEQITAGPEGVIYITKGYPSALQIKWMSLHVFLSRILILSIIPL